MGISGVKVECVDTGDYDSTNGSGYYSFTAPPGAGTYTLRASLNPSYAYVTADKQVSATEGLHETDFKLAWVTKLILGYNPAFYDLCNQNATQAEINQTDIINMAEGIFSSAANKINMTFGIVYGPKNFTTCNSTDAAGLLTQFESAALSKGKRDLAQLFTGDTMDNGATGAAWANTFIDSPYKAVSYIQYVGASDAERSRRSVHEMAHNFDANETTCEEQGEGVVWGAYEGGEYLEYVSMMQYINCSGPQNPTNFFSDGTCRIFDTVSNSGNNTKRILNMASAYLPDD